MSATDIPPQGPRHIAILLEIEETLLANASYRAWKDAEPLVYARNWSHISYIIYHIS